MPMRWQDAVELTRDIAMLCRVNGFLEAAWGSRADAMEGIVRPDLPLGPEEKINGTRTVRDALGRILSAADPYFVDSYLQQLIEVSSRTLPDNTRLSAALFPSDVGCLFFDHPVSGMPPRRLIDDEQGNPSYEPAPMSGFAWAVNQGDPVAKPGVALIFLYSWLGDGLPNRFAGLNVANVPLAVTPWTFDEHTLYKYTRWHNTGLDKLGDNADIASENKERFAMSARLCVATLLLMDQTLTTTARATIDRGARRRLDKIGWPGPREVQVVTLRRLHAPRDPDHEPARIDWSCRWMVRQHWRTLNRGMPDERTVLIPSYVKGPDDKPFRAPSQRVWAVVR